MSNRFFSREDRRSRTRRSVSPALEGLDPRRLLDGGARAAGSAIVAQLEHVIDQDRENGASGVVVKAPHFYEHYVGPKLPQLNAVAAAGELLPNGDFLFVGVNQGVIDPTVPQFYEWGIDRSGKLGTGLFPDRPDIRFDALVALRLVPGKPTTATVMYTTGKNPPVLLSAGSFLAQGSAVAVVVPGSALPSTSLAPSQYKFNYWTEDGQPGATHLASFATEFQDAQVGVIRPDPDHGDRAINEILGVLTGGDNVGGRDEHNGKGHG